MTLVSPAKVNLGLEILGKRPDGYHEIRTVMARVTLHDTLHVGLDPTRLPPSPPVDGVESNLVDTALTAFRVRLPGFPSVTWSLEKHIPVAAGLGGASSNAAAALIAANRIAGGQLDSPALTRIAATIGSDVPFFLGAPVALASGRGVELEPVVASSLDLLLVVPALRIPAKTATLYSLLAPSDFSDGTAVDDTVRLLASTAALDRSHLRNAFSRALGTIDTRMGELQARLDGLGVTWALSGAGPCHYVIIEQPQHEALIGELQASFGHWLNFHSVQTAASPEPG